MKATFFLFFYFFFLYYSYVSSAKNGEEMIEGRHGSKLSKSQPESWLQHWEIVHSVSAGKPRDILFLYMTKTLLLKKDRGLQLPETYGEITVLNCSSWGRQRSASGPSVLAIQNWLEQ